MNWVNDMKKIATTYGNSLYDLAKEEALCDVILNDLQLVLSVFDENPDYRKLLLEPSISKEERRALLDEAWRDQIHLYTLNFLKMLCDNGTIGAFSDCALQYRQRYNEDHGIVEVCAVCASAISQDLQGKLQKKLEHMTGKQIQLTCRVDESLIGGIRLELQGIEYDGSIRHHLHEIQRVLHDTAV